MKKIPTLFKRDPVQNRITSEVAIGCEWVIAGEGQATRKWDGTCCMMRGGKLFKRRELKFSFLSGDLPANFEEVDFDETTQKHYGWVPVADGPEDRWHREALSNSPTLEDGTYELCGPKVQGNPEDFPHHVLVPHGRCALADVPTDYDKLKAYFESHDYEGVVWWHPDGRKAKIKGKDFGVKRKGRSTQ